MLQGSLEDYGKCADACFVIYICLVYRRVRLYVSVSYVDIEASVQMRGCVGVDARTRARTHTHVHVNTYM